MTEGAGYYRHPTIHGDRIVFVSEDDLWSVAATGGQARRLTANPGRASFPVFSPDGSRIAFTGQDEGPMEAYVLDAQGGVPRRLGWLGCSSQTVAWRPDGEAVIVASDWRQPFQKLGFAHLLALPLDGSAPVPLGHGPARALSHAPRGKGVVIGRNSADPARWKRYRGGTAGTIWVDRRGRGAFAPLVKLEGNLASPMWIGSRIYFLSDHEGHGNLYSVEPSGEDLRRHTHHEDYYARFPNTDGKRIVYHAGADLWLFDPESGGTQRIDVRVRSSRPERNRKFVSAARYLEEAELHPKGHSAAVVSRGGLFLSGLWEGAARRHGAVSSARYRLPRWSPDAKRLVAVSDAGGEERLVVVDAARGTEKPLRGDYGRSLEIACTPAGTWRAAVTNQRHELFLVDLPSGRRKRVDHSPFDRITGPTFSPDGRWLAYAYPASRKQVGIRLCDTRTGKTHEVTRPEFRDVAPAFDPEGKYLYFVSWRVFDPVYDSLRFDLGYPRGSRPYLVCLAQDTPSPFEAAQRAPAGPRGAEPEKDAGEKSKSKAKAAQTRVDLDGIQDRVLAFPVPEGRYERILGAKGHALFSSLPIQGSLGQPWGAGGAPPAEGKLERWDLSRDKRETVYEGLSDFAVSDGGGTLAVRVGNRLRVLSYPCKQSDLSAKSEAGRESGWVDLDRLRLEVLPGAEWRQMFREAWRLQRDQFWTADMSGIDWQQVHDRYLPLVDRAGTRAEFSDLVWEMQGELGTSHCYELGGDYRPGPAWHQGFLGADLEQDRRTGRWKIVRIPRGDSWQSRQTSPLAAPGVGVREGDVLVAVGGEAVGRDRSPYEALSHRAGKSVTLEIAPRRAGGKAAAHRTVTIRTLEHEQALRYRDWVEENRAWVHAKSKGEVGYLHIPDMGPLGYAEFSRAYGAEVDRRGLLVDVRFNGGGHVSQLLLTKLARRRIMYDQNRWLAPYPYPEDAPMGPMVALTNEYAGSDGDIFSHSFKLLGLGPLIGKRTWGGVVGIWPRHALVDGSLTTQPEFSAFFEDAGWGVEGYGTDPDIEVEMRPQDYAAGRDPQLERALQEVLAIVKRVDPGPPAFGERPNRRPPRLSR